MTHSESYCLCTEDDSEALHSVWTSECLEDQIWEPVLSSNYQIWLLALFWFCFVSIFFPIHQGSFFADAAQSEKGWHFLIF